MFRKICAITLLLGNIEALKINTRSSNTAMKKGFTNDGVMEYEPAEESKSGAISL